MRVCAGPGVGQQRSMRGDLPRRPPLCVCQAVTHHKDQAVPSPRQVCFRPATTMTGCAATTVRASSTCLAPLRAGPSCRPTYARGRPCTTWTFTGLWLRVTHAAPLSRQGHVLRLRNRPVACSMWILVWSPTPSAVPPSSPWSRTSRTRYERCSPRSNTKCNPATGSPPRPSPGRYCVRHVDGPPP